MPACDADDEDFRGDYDSMLVDCDQYGQCWAIQPGGWDAWAAAITNVQIDDAVAAGVLVSTRTKIAGDQCWRIAGTDGHMCAVFLGTVKLIGRPESELVLTSPAQSCWFEGLWDYNRSGSGMCFGVIEGVAVQLSYAPPF